MPRIFMLYFFIIIGIALDQFTKWLTRNSLELGKPIDVIPGVLNFEYVQNTGAALSILSGYRWILILLTCAILIGLLVYYIKSPVKRLTFTLGTAMIFCGGFGNIIDRVIFGYVTDMISFSFFPPIFNVADIFVTVGCFFIALDAIVLDRR